MNSIPNMPDDRPTVVDHPLSRILKGNLMQRAVMVTAGLGLVGALSRQARASANGHTHVTAYFNTSPGSGAVQIPGTGDVQVLNYALALEDLEASLYAQAIQRLTTGGTSGTGTAFTGLNVTAGDDLTYITEFAQVESDHATFLRNALTSAGGPVIPIFLYDFGMESLSRVEVLSLVYTAELTGVSAYTGAVPFLSSKNYLPVAGGILGTEARHTAVLAAVLNTSLFNVNVKTSPQPSELGAGKDTPLTPDQVLNAGGNVAPSVTIAGDGVLNPVTGPNGVVYQ